MYNCTKLTLIPPKLNLTKCFQIKAQDFKTFGECMQFVTSILSFSLSTSESLDLRSAKSYGENPSAKTQFNWRPGDNTSYATVSAISDIFKFCSKIVDLILTCRPVFMR